MTDLISRADAIEKIKDSLKWIDDNMAQDDAEDEAHDIGFYGALISMERMINELPSAEAVQGCDGCRYNTRIPQKLCLRCKRYWRDSYERKGGEAK